MFNKSDVRRNTCQLFGGQQKCGYDWWWHSFTAHHETTGEEKAFFIEYFLCNPYSGKDVPIFGQLEDNKVKGIKPSYLMVKAGTWGEDAAQVHRFFGWNKIDVFFEVPFSVKAEDCYCAENEMYGCVSVSKKEADEHPEWLCQAGTMSWKLKIDKKVAFNVGYGASSLFRKLQLFEMFWHVEQKTWFNRMVTDIICEKKDMLLVNYEAPTGTKRHKRLWNGGNGKGTVRLYRFGKLVDEVIAKNVGCEYGEYDK